jgi:hypothetical protein
MVQQKHFKSRVRERMQKTGESYTTARLQLLKDLPAEPSVPGLLPGYPLAAPLAQRDAGLWQRVLAQAGVENPATGTPVSEAMLSGLAGGIGFMVFTFEYEQITTATIVTRFHPGPYTGNLINRSGALVEEKSTTSTKAAQDNLDAALEAGRAVVVKVTQGALPWYHSDALEHSDSVDVVVAGKANGEYLIDDGGRELRGVTAAELAGARGKRKKDKHWQASVVDPGGTTVDQLRQSVLNSVAETAGVLLGTVPPAGIPAHVAKNFGLAGMQTWTGRLRDTRTKKGWPAMFADEQRLRFGLERIKECLAGTAWGGPAALRPLYAQFLAEAATLDGLDRLQEAAQLYVAVGERWQQLADAVDPQCPAAERTAHFAALADRMEDIQAAEEAAANSLSG